MMKKAILLSASLLILCACGGSSTEPVLPAPDPDPVPIPDPTNIADPLFPANPAVTSCGGLDFIKIISAESDANSEPNFEAENAIDGSLVDADRWESSDATASVTLDLGYRHQIKEIGTAWHQGNQSVSTFDLEVSQDGVTYEVLLSSLASSGETRFFDRFDIPDTVARFVRIVSFGDSVADTTALLEASVFGCPLDIGTAPLDEQTVDLTQFNLDPSLPPGNNFDLLSWALDTPEEDPDDGNSLRASELSLDNGYVSDDYFFTADDGGMVFRSTIFGAKTSANTSFTRSELRGMLRRGNTGISTQGVNLNNWVLGYQPETPQQVGGRGGNMKATLKVDHVTTDGSQSHTGRFIIGQIHASQDEPIRLYYKKFPNNERGYIYFAHELRGGDDIWRMVLGPQYPESSENSQPIFTENPEQGIALGEIFSYEIDQSGGRIDVIIRRGDLNGPIIAHEFVNMNDENSEYDVVEEWHYFKAGAYSQNNTGDDDAENNGANSDFDQVTFYHLEVSHPENTLLVDQGGAGFETGNQFASITDTDDSDTGELRYALGSALAQGRLALTYSRTDDNVGSADAFISLFNSANMNDNSILDLRVKDDSFETRFPSRDIDQSIVSVSPGEPQEVIITWEYPNGDTSTGVLPEVSVAIDGTLISEPFFPEGSSPEGGVSTISFRFGNNSAVISAQAMFNIDNIALYSDVAGNVLIFEDDFESYDDGEDLDPNNNASSPYANNTTEAKVAIEP